MNITNVPKVPMIQNSTELRTFFNQLVNQLQEFLSNERYKLPTQSNTTVPVLNNNVDKNIGGILYNESSKTTQVNTNGIFNNVATYEELTAAQVSAIASGERNGRFIFETDTGDLRVGMNDLFKTVTVT